VDDRALEIVKRAKENEIPIIRYTWLARTLFSTGKEKAFIPRKVIKPMAAVFRAVREIEASEESYDFDQIKDVEHG